MSNKLDIKNIILPLSKIPIIDENAFIKEALEKMSELKIGICCIVKKDKVQGIITDGDIRRIILNLQKPFSAFLVDEAILYANKNPKLINVNNDLGKIINIMEENDIWDILIINDEDSFLGLLHLHHIVKKLLL